MDFNQIIIKKLLELEFKPGMVWTPQMYLPFRDELNQVQKGSFDNALTYFVSEGLLIEEPNGLHAPQYRLTEKGAISIGTNR